MWQTHLDNGDSDFNATPCFETHAFKTKLSLDILVHYSLRLMHAAANAHQEPCVVLNAWPVCVCNPLQNF